MLIVRPLPDRHAAIIKIQEGLQRTEIKGFVMPLREASASIISGSREPSIWRCSSALGRDPIKSDTATSLQTAISANDVVTM